MRSRALAGLLAVTILGLGVLTVAPGLHHDLHHDADHASHYCAVDLFAAGVALAATMVALQQLAVRRLGSVVPVALAIHAARAWRQPPGRGPPSISS